MEFPLLVYKSSLSCDQALDLIWVTYKISQLCQVCPLAIVVNQSGSGSPQLDNLA